MRIALLTELFLPNIGGQEIRFAEIADNLALRGHDVEVFTIRTLDTMAEQEVRSSGAKVTRRPGVSGYQRPPGSRFPRSPWGMVRFAVAARRWLAQQDAFDAILLNQWPLVHALALRRSDRRRAVVDWCEIRSTPPYTLFQDFLPRMMAANTAVSNAVAAHIEARAHRRPVVMIPSGIVLARYHADAAETRRGILYLGRISPHKDVPMLIAAYNVLCAAGCDEPLIIAGGGQPQVVDDINTLIAQSPYRSRIVLTGVVSENRKIELLASARILAITSTREGFPRVVGEAMASGLPTVTTRHPGNGTVGVVEEFQCGVCADPTPDAVADAISQVLIDWNRYSVACLAQARHVDMDRVVSAFETLLGQVADNQSKEQVPCVSL